MSLRQTINQKIPSKNVVENQNMELFPVTYFSLHDLEQPKNYMHDVPK
jgi:hypothetical protein